MYNKMMYETVKTVNGLDIYRCRGINACYMVTRTFPNGGELVREFHTQREAIAYIKGLSA